jgi:RNA polymerase sigma factor (TIGR02999 family)
LFQELRAAGRTNQEIFEAAYYELKQLARKMCGGLGAGKSMNASRLLSDLWLKVSGKLGSDFDWNSGAHFFSTMALAMQQLLIDHARRTKRQAIDSLDQLMEAGYEPSSRPFNASQPQNKNWFQEKADQTLQLEAALTWLEEKSEMNEVKRHIAIRQAEIVRLRLYDGLEEDEVAQILGISSETVTKDFRKAKAKLLHFLKRANHGAGEGP